MYSTLAECLWASVGLDVNDPGWHACPNYSHEMACFCFFDIRECGDPEFVEFYCLPLQENPLPEVRSNMLLIIEHQCLIVQMAR